MVSVTLQSQLTSSILSIFANDTKIYAIDNYNTLYIRSMKELQKYQTIPLSGQSEPLPFHRYSKCCDMGSELFHLPGTITGKSIILKEREGKYQKTVFDNLHKHPIECVKHSTHGKYLATGGADGVINIFDVKSGYQRFYSSPPESDYILAIGFSHCSNYMAYSSYNGTLQLFDLECCIFVDTVHTDDVVELIQFHNDGTILLCHRKGELSRYHIREKKHETLQYNLDNWPTTSCRLKHNPGYVLIGTKSGEIHAYDFKHDELVFKIKVHDAGIASMYIHDNELYIGYVDGKFCIIDMQAKMDEFQIALKVNSFADAREVANQNLFLTLDSGYTSLMDELWEKEIYPDIAVYLSKNNFEEAKEKAKPFLCRRHRKESFDLLMEQKAEYDSFSNAVRTGDLELAYQLTDIHRFLRETELYAMLENSWEKIVMKIRSILENKTPNSKELIQKMLKPYTNIRIKKKAIITLLQGYENIQKAEEAVRKKDFSTFFSLSEKFPVIKELTLYKKVMLMTEQYINRIIKLEQEGKYKLAYNSCQKLKPFHSASMTLREKTHSLKEKITFLDAIERNDTTKIFKRIEENRELQNMKEFKEYYRQFETDFERALNFAYQGQPANTLQGLYHILEIPYFAGKVHNIMKVAYLNQIENNHLSDKEWNMAYYNYTRLFGIDQQILDIAYSNKYPADTSDINKTDPDTPKKYVESILSMEVQK